MASIPPLGQRAHTRPSTAILGGVIDASAPAPACASVASAAGTGTGLVNTQQVARDFDLALENTIEHRSQRRAMRCRHRTLTRARLLDEGIRKGGFRGRWLMVTGTYREDVNWHADHLSHLMHRMRQWFRRQGVDLRYVWVMELTKRGRPHYHILIWLPRHLMLPCPDKRGWWPHGMTRTEVARNAVGYLAKYASKMSEANWVGDFGDDGQTVVMRAYPRHARICGGTVLKADFGREWRYWTAPRWARERVAELTDLRRVPGGYLVTDTGEFLPTPWQYIGKTPCGKYLLFRLLEPCGA